VEWRKTNRYFGMGRFSKLFHVPGPGVVSPALRGYDGFGTPGRTLPEDFVARS